jgi:hypothetical protein
MPVDLAWAISEGQWLKTRQGLAAGQSPYLSLWMTIVLATDILGLKMKNPPKRVFHCCLKITSQRLA